MWWTTITGVIGSLSGLEFILALATQIIHYRRQHKWVDYKVEYDGPLGLSPRPAAGLDLHVVRDGVVLDNVDIAVFRVRNAGRAAIPSDDIAEPLAFLFPDRRVIHVKISDPNSAALDARLTTVEPLMNDRHSLANRIIGEVSIPRITLHGGDSFRMLVLLQGDGHRRGIETQGVINDGGFGRSRSRRSFVALTSITTTSFVVLGIVFGLLLAAPTPPPYPCRVGALTIEGSTGFADIAQQLANRYQRSCHSAHVTVKDIGSLAAVDDLNEVGTKNPQNALSILAMSGGPAAPQYGFLVPHPVGVNLYTVVVNPQVGIHNLTLDQIRGIYDGKYRNWRELGGADKAITLVSRTAASGTRSIFERKILGHAEQLGVSSSDCRYKDRDPHAVLVHCETTTTQALINKIKEVPGAIGYAGLASARSGGVTVVTLNDVPPLSRFVVSTPPTYPFWDLEYFYTYGPTGRDTLLTAFLQYMQSVPANKILQEAGYLPCIDQINRALCYP
jgi:phosphate transport system substrate-binding protein